MCTIYFTYVYSTYIYNIYIYNIYIICISHNVYNVYIYIITLNNIILYYIIYILSAVYYPCIHSFFMFLAFLQHFGMVRSTPFRHLAIARPPNVEWPWQERVPTSGPTTTR